MKFFGTKLSESISETTESLRNTVGREKDDDEDKKEEEADEDEDEDEAGNAALLGLAHLALLRHMLMTDPNSADPNNTMTNKERTVIECITATNSCRASCK